MTGDHRGPVTEIRIGRIKAAIWENQGEGGTWHTVQLSRLYRAGEGWKSSFGLGRDDLLVAAKVLDQAHTRILELQAVSGVAESAPDGADVEEPAAEGE